MRLNHLDLPVSDPHTAKHFFENHFGFRTIFIRSDLVVMLDSTDFALTLSAKLADGDQGYPTGFHVGFNLNTEAELQAIYQNLLAAKVSLARPLGLLGGALTFQCFGPDQILIEMAWRDNH
jgi:catechol 2,3-dioxygenase-like lactoylglutathione lyase family enzyme